MRNRLALIWAAILGRPIMHRMSFSGTIVIDHPRTFFVGNTTL